MIKIWNFLIMPIFSFGLLCFTFQLYTFQNQTELDSLKGALNSGALINEVQKVKILNELSLLYRNQNKDSSIYFASQALDLAQGIGNEIEVINSLIKLGITHRTYSEPEKALEYYRKGLTLARNLKSTSKMSSLVNNMANVFKDMVQLDSAIHYGLENLKIKIELGVDRRISQAYNNLGTSYSDNRSYDLAIDAFKNSLLLEMRGSDFDAIIASDDIELNFGAIRALNNLGNVYFQSGQMDSAQFVYSKVRRNSAGNMAPHQDANNYNGLANILKNEGDYHRSKSYYDSSLAIYVSIGRLPEVGRTINNMGLVHLGISDYDSSLFYLDSAMRIAESMGDLDLIKVVELNLSEVYASLGDYRKSLEHIRKFKSLDSALYFIEKERNINEIRTLYEVERIEKDLLRRDLLYQEAKLQRNTFRLSFGIVALLAILILYRFYSARKLAKQSKRLHNQEINELLANQELSMIQAAIEAEEKERERIAEDLHDRLGSTLSATRMHVEALEEELAATGNREAIIVKDLLDKAINDTREISHNIISGVLEKFGLIAALKDLRDTVESTNKLRFELDFVDSDLRLEEERELHIFRIVQELVSNTLKHAYADRVLIRLRREEDGVEMLFEDNGIGFNTEKNFEGIGLKNIESRLMKINAEWDIASDAHGTKVKVKLAA